MLSSEIRSTPLKRSFPAAHPVPTTHQEKSLPDHGFIPRSYQTKILEVAMRQNTISVLDTGSGKTMIAVMLINSIGQVIKSSPEQNQLIIFLAPTVHLVNQQYNFIKAHTNLRVGQYYGLMDIDFWGFARWKDEIDSHDVMVMTPQILLDALRRAILSIKLVHLLIFDECHRATGSHAYTKIMKEFYHKSINKPKIFGMTASPVISKGFSSNRQCENKISDLESVLDSQIYTVKDRVEVDTVVPFAKELCKFYDRASFVHSKLKAKLGSSWSKFDGELIKLHKSVPCCYKDMNDKLKKLQRNLSAVHSKILYCLDDVGLLGAYEAVIHCIENAPCTWDKYDFFGNCFMQYKCFLEEALHIFEEFFPHGNGDLPHIGSDYIKAVNIGLISPKLLELIKLFLSFGRESRVSCLIFVERIITAIVITRTMKKIRSISHLTVSFLSGSTSSVDALAPKSQKETLESFHSGKVNLLIATDVLEEGINVRNCSCVIRFDLPKTVRSYVQSRGRARQKDSQFIMMIERGNMKHVDQLFDIIRSERSVADAAINRDPDVFSVKTCTFDEADAYFVDATGASVTTDSSVHTIHQYCAKLPGDMYFSPKPDFQFLFSEGLSSCKLTLPVNAAFQTLVGPSSKNSLLSKQLVCLEACKKLHHLGALDDQLLPSIEEHLEKHSNITCKELAGAGTKKRKELHGSACIRALSGTWGDRDIGATFQAYEMRFSCDAAGHIYSGFVLLLESKLEDDVGNIEVDLYLHANKVVKSSISFCGKVHLNGDEVKKAKVFQELFFNGLFGKLFVGSKSSRTPRFFLLNAENKSFWSPSNMYLLLPFQPFSHERLKINWGVINSSFLAAEFLKNNCQLGLQHSTGNTENILSRISMVDAKVKNLNFVHLANDSPSFENLKGKVVIAVHTGKIYSVVSEVNDSSAESPFDGGGYRTFTEYFKKKYGIVLMHPGQPLLKLKQSHNPHNLLVDFNNKDMMTDQPRSYVHMPPELLVIVDVSIDVLKSLYLLPSLMHRLQSLMLASQLREDIACYFCCIPSSLMLEGLTTLRCSEVFSMERLELLGDSVLKYAVSCHLFFKYPKKHEGQLSDRRSFYVCNSNLHKVGTNHNLQAYIQDAAFEPLRWTAPGQRSIHEMPCLCGVDTLEVPLGKFYREDDGVVIGKPCDRGHRWIASKTISDCVEALIGAYYIAGGLGAALYLMEWLGIVVGLDPISVTDVVKNASLHSYAPMKTVVETLEGKLGYKFSVKGLLLEAVTHPSVQELGVSYCYQRLEFLGDSVLDLLITQYLYQTHADIDQGQLTDLRSASVNNESFSQAAIRNNLQEHLQHCSGLLSNQIAEYVQSLSAVDVSKPIQTLRGPKALGDMIEGIAGAILIDSELKLDEVWRVLKPLLSPIVTPESLELHPLRELQELCSSLGYFVKETCSNNQREMVSIELYVQLRDELVEGRGYGKSRRDARGQAAFKLLKNLEDRGISRCRPVSKKRTRDDHFRTNDEQKPHKKQMTTKSQLDPVAAVPSSTGDSSATPVIASVNTQKGGPRQVLYSLCSKQQWPMPGMTVEHQSSVGVVFGEGPEKRKGLNSFIAKASLCIPNDGRVECMGDARADKKSATDSAALHLLSELQRLGKLIIRTES